MPDETHNYLINFETSAMRAQQDVTALSTTVQSLLPATAAASTGFAQLTSVIAGSLAIQEQEIASKQLMVVTLDNVARTAITAGAGIAYLTAQITQAQQLTSGGRPLLQPPPSGGVGAGGYVSPTEQLFNEYGVSQSTPVPPPVGGVGRGRGGDEGGGGDGDGGGGGKGGWIGRYAARYLIRYFLIWQTMQGVQQIIRDWSQAHEDLDRTMFRLQTTMGMTTVEAERYMATMRGMGTGMGISGVALAGGATTLGPTGAGMAGQFGAMAGIGAGAGMEFFAGIRRQYDLTAAQIEQLIPRMFAAFTVSGQDWQTFSKNWETMLTQFDRGSSAVSEWTRALEIYETTGMRASERVSAEYQSFLQILGDTEGITNAKNAIADLFAFLARNADAVNYALGNAPPLGLLFQAMGMGVQPTGAGGVAATDGGPITTAHEEWRLTGISPAEQAGALPLGFVASGYERMTQAQYDQYERLTEKWEAVMEERGLTADKLDQQIIIAQEGNIIAKTTETNVLASALALEEMNDRQRNAVYNWPSGAGGTVMIGQGGMGQTRLQTSQAATPPTPPPYVPFGSTVPYVPGANPSWHWGDIFGYQHGGIVPGPIGQPQAAIVHGGETITPPGQGGMSAPILLKTQINVDGRRIAESSDYLLGDRYYQASRASHGTSGGLISI